MASSGMLRRVALVRTDVSEELSASIIRVVILSLLTRATPRNIPEDTILQTEGLHPDYCELDCEISLPCIEICSTYYNILQVVFQDC
jgi:hypothetical protein